MDEKKVIDFVNNGIYTQKTIEVFLFENKTTYSKLLKILFKLSTNCYGDYSQDINTLFNFIDLINIIITNTELNDEEVVINKQRLEKMIGFLDNKYKTTNDDKYLYLIEKSKKIILDKKKNKEEIKKLVILLINKKETIHVILALIESVKDINSDGALFNYVFDMLTSNQTLSEYDQIYYIELLKAFYCKSIDKKNYTSKLGSINYLEPLIYNEIYNIIHGKFNSLSKKETEYKFGITENLITCPITPRTTRNTCNADVITFDTNIFNIKDDGISIRKDGNKYVIGIHMCDVGGSIKPESILDIQARNITKEIYLPDKKIQMLPVSVKQKLSLDRGAKRGSVSLYIIMNEYGEIIDYYLSKDDVNVKLNLTYDDALKIIEKKCPNEFEKSIQQLYRFSDVQRKNTVRNKRYVTAKRNKFGSGLYNSKGFLMVSEFMILYNSLIPAIASERNIPFIYKAKDRSYIPDLIANEGMDLDDETIDAASNIFLDSYFTNSPSYHMTLGKKYYATCSAPMRKYSSLYNQYLLHMFFFKDQMFDFKDKDFNNLIEYLNDRGKELDLFTNGYRKKYTSD